MFILDLKLTLFFLLLAGLALAGLVGWLAWRQARANSGWRALASLPVGVVVQADDGAVTFRNSSAQQLAGTTALEPLLERLGVNGAAAPQSGLMNQPRPLRWWRARLGDASVVTLADAGEQQQFITRQNAFVSQLAHELRTPLMAIAAHTEVVRSSAEDEKLRATSLAVLQRESGRMGRLVRDLLELYRLEAAAELSLQPVHVALVAEAAISQVYPRAEERNLELTLETSGRLPPVLAHPDRLAQVFGNLLANAINYCRPGDAIVVRLTTEPDCVRCTVQDTGPGIPPADLPHVTERLYRGRKDVAGTGLGLALVVEILRRHHSQLHLESRSDGSATGTTASWLLPVAPRNHS
ncbi:MAG: HAMP domain-containing histidine kinase [Chloroflexaceae bacterium]|jgi:signal transduction histidine kinase|nr:HAMP domain-containing histidine kinase [Chloroflexaceae bacterium]